MRAAAGPSAALRGLAGAYDPAEPALVTVIVLVGVIAELRAPSKSLMAVATDSLMRLKAAIVCSLTRLLLLANLLRNLRRTRTAYLR